MSVSQSANDKFVVDAACDGARDRAEREPPNCEYHASFGGGGGGFDELDNFPKTLRVEKRDDFRLTAGPSIWSDNQLSV